MIPGVIYSHVTTCQNFERLQGVRQEIYYTSPVMVVVGGHILARRDTIARLDYCSTELPLTCQEELRTVTTPALGPSFFCAPASIWC
jgi:hypothetical protein